MKKALALTGISIVLRLCALHTLGSLGSSEAFLRAPYGQPAVHLVWGALAEIGFYGFLTGLAMILISFTAEQIDVARRHRLP